MGQSRRASRPKLGPAANCQTLVTKDGTINSEAAFAGAMTRLSKPIETVGSPSPITPLTKPASRKVRVATMRGRCSTGTSDCETKSTALGSLPKLFTAEMRKNAAVLTPPPALEPNKPWRDRPPQHESSPVAWRGKRAAARGGKRRRGALHIYCVNRKSML